MSLSNSNLLAPFQSQHPASVDLTCATRIPDISGAAVSQVPDLVDPPAPEINAMVASSQHTMFDSVPSTNPTAEDGVAIRSTRPSAPVRTIDMVTNPAHTEHLRSQVHRKHTSACDGYEQIPVLTPGERKPEPVVAAPVVAAFGGEVGLEANEDIVQRNVSSRTSTNVGEDIGPIRGGLTSAITIASGPLQTQPQNFAGRGTSGIVKPESIAMEGRGIVTNDVMMLGSAIRRVGHGKVKVEAMNETGFPNQVDETEEANVGAGTVAKKEPTATGQIDESVNGKERHNVGVKERLSDEEKTGETEVNGARETEGAVLEKVAVSRKCHQGSRYPGSGISPKAVSKEIGDYEPPAAKIPEEGCLESQVLDGLKPGDDCGKSSEERQALRTKKIESCERSGEMTEGSGVYQDRAGKEDGGYRQCDVSHVEEYGNKAMLPDSSSCSVGESATMRSRANEVKVEVSGAMNECGRDMGMAQSSKSECQDGHGQTMECGEAMRCAGPQEPTSEKDVGCSNAFKITGESSVGLDSQGLSAGREGKDLSDTKQQEKAIASGGGTVSLPIGEDATQEQGRSEKKDQRGGMDHSMKDVGIVKDCAVSQQTKGMSTSAEEISRSSVREGVQAKGKCWTRNMGVGQSMEETKEQEDTPGTMQCTPSGKWVEREVSRGVEVTDLRGDSRPALAEKIFPMACDLAKTDEGVAPTVAMGKSGWDTDRNEVTHEGSPQRANEISRLSEQNTEMRSEYVGNEACTVARKPETSGVIERMGVRTSGRRAHDGNGDGDYRASEDKRDCGSEMVGVSGVGQGDGAPVGTSGDDRGTSGDDRWTSGDDRNDGVGGRLGCKRKREGVETRMTRKRRRNAELLSRAEVGDVVSVYWEDDKQFYDGVIREKRADGKYRIVYFDGDVEVLDLSDPKETWRLTNNGRV